MSVTAPNSLHRLDYVEPSTKRAVPSTRTSFVIMSIIIAWATIVAVGSAAGWFVAFPLPFFAALVAALLIASVGAYVVSDRLRGAIEVFGLRRLTALHVWRIPAALAFFHYGSQGLLPPLFVTLAGWGDMLAGVLALITVLFFAKNRAAYWAFHVVGMADFVLAVGTGLAFSLLQEPSMATIAMFPMALIPLFGVTLSGATHIAAFDMLRRQ